MPFVLALPAVPPALAGLGKAAAFVGSAFGAAWAAREVVEAVTADEGAAEDLEEDTPVVIACATCAANPYAHLACGAPGGTYRGGAHGCMQRPAMKALPDGAIHSHHMPANAFTAMSRPVGPAIQMAATHHRSTASYGASPVNPGRYSGRAQMTDATWELLPQRGLGPLEFGMDAGAATLLAAFGTVDSDQPLGTDMAVAEETLDMFGAGLTLGQRDALLRDILAENAALADARLIVLSSGLQLTFTAGALTKIVADRGAFNLHIQGHSIFRGDILPALRTLEEANGSPALADSDALLFPSLNVHLKGFVTIAPDGRMSRRNPSGEQPGDRTVQWSQGSATPAQTAPLVAAPVPDSL